MGLKFTRQFSKKRLKNQRRTASQEEDGGDGGEGEEEQEEGGEEETDGRTEADGATQRNVRALYTFQGSNDDEVNMCTFGGERGGGLWHRTLGTYKSLVLSEVVNTGLQ